MSEPSTKLNLGSGKHRLPGYVNLDAQWGHSIYPLCQNYALPETDSVVTLPEEGVDEIRASHVLEHFSHRETADVLKDWVSHLKPGGVLKIAVPNFRKIAEDYLSGVPSLTQGYTMGGQVDENDFHRCLFDEASLRKLLADAGLTAIRSWESEIRDCASLPVSLNLMGTKPANGAVNKVSGVNGVQERDLTDRIDRGSAPEPDLSIAEHLQPLWRAIKARKRNVYSQFGEDGAVEAIFEAIGTENKWCLEVGAGDGIFFSNTRQFVEQGWFAILIEKDPALFSKLVANTEKMHCFRENLEIGCEAPNSLDAVLSKHGAPTNIDLLSLDIDGPDWHVFNAMLDYRPRVVIVEYAIEGDVQRFHGYDYIPARGGPGQAGRDATIKLLCGKGYMPVAVTTSNVIAVQGELLGKLQAWAAAQPAVEAAVSALQEKKPQPAAPANAASEPVVIRAVMSMPRLAFSDNMFCSISALCLALGINLEKGSGVFWDQVLTRMIESHLDDGTKYILTVDYDTWFRKEHVVRLCQLMQEHPEIDALVPLQTKREEDLVLFSMIDERGQPAQRVPRAELEKDVTPIVNGHFGLTVFRAASFAKLAKPWFRGEPDPDGGWGDGRTDPDIYFWRNFYRSGLKACLAPNVRIGHLQLMATFPGALADGWKPVHAYVTDLEKDILPPGVVPAVEYLK